MFKIIGAVLYSMPLNGRTLRIEQAETFINPPMQKFAIFPTVEWYGNGSAIRKLGFYPNFLPLCVTTPHGVQIDFTDKLASYEANSKADIIFYNNDKSGYLYKKVNPHKTYKKVVFPIAFFAGFQKRNNAKRGTVAFPVHSTNYATNTFDPYSYLNELLSLPDRYKPISVCMYYQDINKGSHKIFLENGIEVYCAGHRDNPAFGANVLEIISYHRYSTSNCLGTHAFLCISSGIPFFLFGEHPTFYNHGHELLNSGKCDYFENEDYCKLAKIFEQRLEYISSDQQDANDYYMGIKGSIGRLSLACWLYYSFFKTLLTTPLLKNYYKYLIKKLLVMKCIGDIHRQIKHMQSNKSFILYGTGYGAMLNIDIIACEQWGVRYAIDDNMSNSDFFKNYNITVLQNIENIKIGDMSDNVSFVFLVPVIRESVYKKIMQNINNNFKSDNKIIVWVSIEKIYD